ncbi:uncharacterized protein PITG_19598 [Phytophthora infestans T30-4]|uniref:Uncharacterized protein n=1 Tax=Phytophthora infestans (strain T30-4) TaxID=403677 RepID=D0P0V6_PHYIT|nr:uncharacterized protein PITG_19598 [Phytophthora infestans T30-4]EEY53078.1 conserved hypothetical protein [Phytophthora infestans T30-4]|eukprot:XP_002896072.1 conserved hypothetical protein [Phytophthora infestans T30-4]
MAEVLYRYKTHNASTTIDVYESLLGRLRGSNIQISLYAMYDELISLRLSFLHASKRIQWPSSNHLPFYFSVVEVLFVRGYVVQCQEEMMRIPVDRRRSWRDYRALHQELLELEKKSARISGNKDRMLSSVRYRAENIERLKIFTTIARLPPTWTNLAPSWEEDIEILVSSAKISSNTISMMNRVRRNSRWQDADTIGYL